MSRVIALILVAILLLGGCGINSKPASVAKVSEDNSSIPIPAPDETDILKRPENQSHKNGTSITTNSASPEEGAPEVFENPSTENMPVTDPDAGSPSSEAVFPAHTPTGAETQEILSAISDMLDQYKAVGGVFPWYSWNARIFPPYPADASYPDLATGVFKSVEGNVLAKFDAGKYHVLFTVMNIRGDWSIEGIQITEKATGKKLPLQPPRYTDEERIDFDDFLIQNLDENWYTYVYVATTGIEPVIGYVDGFQDKIDAVIAQYNGACVETKRIKCPYSRAQLNACSIEIQNLPIVRVSRANKERKISGIFINDEKVEVALLEPMPGLEEELASRYPADMVVVKIYPDSNPTT